MSGLSPELLATMAAQGYHAEKGGKHAVAREESAAEGNTFRSGWSRPPRVPAPRGCSPAGSESSSQSAGGSSAGRMGMMADRIRNPVFALRGRAKSNVSDRSDRDCSEGSNASSAQTSKARPGSATSSEGVHHEGWLSKRSSHKLAGGMAARWQSRYWTLQGCTFRYHKNRGAPSLRSFDLRRVRHIEMAEGQSRELELDFGFRVWRLRAENPEAARRWLLLLDAARLVAGEPLGNAEDPATNFSDDDSTGSSRSTADSVASGSRASTELSQAQGTPRRPASAGQSRAQNLLPTSVKQLLPRSFAEPVAPAPVQVPVLLCASAVADRLEIDPDELDKRFEAWFASGSSGEDDTPHFGEARRASSTRRGLSEALAAMWNAFGGDGLDGALVAWKGPQLPEPQAFADAAEGVLSEYLSHMLRRLEQWVKKSDPIAEEVEDVATWFLFEARPALDTFEARSCKELNSKAFTAWRTIADQLEMLLLGEWETRSCDEVCERVEAAYSPTCSWCGARIDMVLELLQGVLQGEAWQGHAAACDRSASVLIAALNAVLRSYRKCARALLGLPDAGVSRPQQSRAKRLTSKVLKGLSKHSINCMEEAAPTSTHASREAAAAAVAEAARLTSFCRTAQPASQANATVCEDVLLAFAGAFEREGAHICTFLAETHFLETHRQTLAEVRFGNSRCASPKLTAVCEAARGFLDATLEHPTSPGAAQICDALIRTIVQHWLRAFRRGPPKLSVTTVGGLTTCITADVAGLRQLAARFGAEAIWASSSPQEDPLQPMSEVRQMFSDPSSEGLSFGAARLEVMLGDERGQALASAVRLAIAR